MHSSAKTSKIAWAVAGLFTVGAAAVIACGPDFPLQLLDDRAGTLKNTPANSFAWEAAHLVAPSDQLQADEGTTYEGQREDDPGSLRMREKGKLDDAQFVKLKAMRAQPDGDAAYAAGAGLPAAVRLYTAAAQDYRAARGDGQQASSAELAERARKRFEAVLALPPQDGAERAVWAAYMLARLHADNALTVGVDSAAAAERKQAVAGFEKTRALALAGAADPLGLAVASYGEQARLYLVGDGGAQCGWHDFNEGECVDGIAPADLKRAIRLYAEQAARGSASALASLQAIASRALMDAGSATALIDDAVSQRLLVAFALARMGDVVSGQDGSVYTYDPTDATSGASGYADAARGGAGVKPNPDLANLVDALGRRGLEKVAGADRIVALAYRTGRYELAAALAQKQESALAWWVRAKLALRRGDNEAAAQAYARAAQGFPKADASLAPGNAALMVAEQGVLALARGQYIEALEQLRRAAGGKPANDAYYYSSFGDYVNDMSYVAERVLTTDELKAYVDAHVPGSPMPAADAVAKATKKEQGPMAARYAALSLSPTTVDDRLRQLLARRLVREGRVEESLKYFPDERDERFVDSSYEDGAEKPVSWRARAKAREYGEALEQARHAWRSTRRAEGWYRAAVIARRQGLEIMGYEQGPDYAVYGGGYTYGAGRDGSVYYDAGNDRKPRPDTAEGRAQADLSGPLVTPEERKRYAATEARPYKRFHYRDVAADYAGKSADELPPRSQAFAAVLCQATNFVFYDEKRAPELYRRYVKEGAAVPFAVDFGQNCVEPDFAAAARFPYVQAWRGTRAWVGAHRAVSAALLLAAVLAAAAGLAVWRRRRRAG